MGDAGACVCPESKSFHCWSHYSAPPNNNAFWLRRDAHSIILTGCCGHCVLLKLYHNADLLESVSLTRLPRLDDCKYSGPLKRGCCEKWMNGSCFQTVEEAEIWQSRGWNLSHLIIHKRHYEVITKMNYPCSNPVSLCQYIPYLSVHANGMPGTTILGVFISESVSFLFPSNAFDDLSFI